MNVWSWLKLTAALWLIRKAFRLARWVILAAIAVTAWPVTAMAAAGYGAAWLRGWPPARLYRAAAWSLPMTGVYALAAALQSRTWQAVALAPLRDWRTASWAADGNSHPALTDTWQAAQDIGRQRKNTPDPGTRRAGARLYPYRSRLHCRQCGRRMHGAPSPSRRPGENYIYYVCPTHMHKPDDRAKYPGHIRASIRQDILTRALSQFLDTYAFGHDRAARLATLIPATQAQQDDLNQHRAEDLARQLKQADTALGGIAAEIGQLAGKTDTVSNAIRDRLTQQFSDRHDQKTAIETELAAINNAAPLPGNDLTLIDELPHAAGLLTQCPPEFQEQLAAAFDLHAVYRPAENQATITVTITDTTPGIITAILSDPRTDHDTAATPASSDPTCSGTATSANTSVDVPHDAMVTVATDVLASGPRRFGQTG